MKSVFDSGAWAHRALGGLLPALLLMLWLATAETGMVAPYLLPHPKDVLVTATSYVFGQGGQAGFAGRFVDDFVASITLCKCAVQTT